MNSINKTKVRQEGDGVVQSEVQSWEARALNSRFSYQQRAVGPCSSHSLSLSIC